MDDRKRADDTNPLAGPELVLSGWVEGRDRRLELYLRKEDQQQFWALVDGPEPVTVTTVDRLRFNREP